MFDRRNVDMTSTIPSHSLSVAGWLPELVFFQAASMSCMFKPFQSLNLELSYFLS